MSTDPDPVFPSLVLPVRRYPMPEDPASMRPFMEGLDPSGRRILVLLPCFGLEVGMIVTTTIEHVECVALSLVVHVREFVFQDIQGDTMCEVRLSSVVFDVIQRRMRTPDERPCFFVIDDSRGHSVSDHRDIFARRYPEARFGTVEK